MIRTVMRTLIGLIAMCRLTRMTFVVSLGKLCRQCITASPAHKIRKMGYLRTTRKETQAEQWDIRSLLLCNQPLQSGRSLTVKFTLTSHTSWKSTEEDSPPDNLIRCNRLFTAGAEKVCRELGFSVAPSTVWAPFLIPTMLS
jgi:hypothetical protein